MSSTYAVPAVRTRRPAAPRSVAAQSARRSTVRLTHRGRVVVVALALLVMLALGVVLGSVSSATDEPGPTGTTETVRVGAGDTLWAIASERAADGESVQSVIDEIRSLNAMSSGSLQAGQLLVVPTS
ncbi:LysM peptidoglycan-binding domain-containing protein [Nocardioides sp. ChNu-153]|uniref:LysM peptidoglycan-binding domain-containing protein n=1 Tax=unclassified Nocardioides TaxID=2615069 RepID=UPI0024068E0B|nr:MULTISPECIES: LysM peptidoglycan-binding domain-containing protein [unclassified Nocardioides]MDF9715100.1 LysM peptidoglycan-binding domain-containing protein [Nocardioides sp. ChNu-99]MDN7122370.1 LysM peptidoglycan-binding domain-containing protein [Nocardioides sp. ChNu-153]